MEKRWEVINFLIHNNNYTNYLEIGIRGGGCFKKIICENKEGVDPNPKCKCKNHMTSDDFFNNIPLSQKYDIIFIDGLHLENQVLRDIQNSLKHLSENGTIVLHDCNPMLEERQLEYKKSKNAKWNGTVWKAFVKLRMQRSDLKMLVVDIDHGCGIITKGKQDTLKYTKNIKLNFDFLDKNREEILNLISVEKFINITNCNFNKNKNIKKTLIIRHNYERTYMPFLYHNIKMVEPDEIISITGQPFSETFEKMINLCSKMDSDVFITVDADMYITNSYIIKKNINKSCANFFIKDKFRSKKQRGGVHIYSSSFMKQMYEILQNRPIPIKRPEGGTVRHVKQKFKQKEYVEHSIVAYHDFYQYRLDIFYKYVYRGWRTNNLKAKKWFKAWEKSDDLDFQVARKAIEWSWKNPITKYPKGILKKDVVSEFKKLNIKEKPETLSLEEEKIEKGVIL